MCLGVLLHKYLEHSGMCGTFMKLFYELYKFIIQKVKKILPCADGWHVFILSTSKENIVMSDKFWVWFKYGHQRNKILLVSIGPFLQCIFYTHAHLENSVLWSKSKNLFLSIVLSFFFIFHLLMKLSSLIPSML